MSISLSGSTIVKFHNVALALNCDSNLILLGQLQENRITYHDNPMSMILIKNGKVVTKAKREQNLFILDFTTPN